MLAVIEIGGNQFTVQQGDIIETKRQNIEIDSHLTIPALLLSDEDGKDVKVWTPEVAGSKVELKALQQFKWEKVRVFKMKSKKRMNKNNGFRPSITKFEVLSIS